MGNILGMSPSVQVVFTVEKVRPDPPLQNAAVSKVSFFLDCLQESEWTLDLDMDQNGLCAELFRAPSGGPEELTVDWELRLFIADGKRWGNSPRKTTTFRNSEGSGLTVLATRQELLDNSNGIFKEENLKVSIRLWPTRANSVRCRPTTLFACSRSGVPMKVTWVVDKYSSLRSGKREYVLNRMCEESLQIKIVLFVRKGKVCVQFVLDFNASGVLLEEVLVVKSDGQNATFWKGQQFLRFNGGKNACFPIFDERMLTVDKSKFLQNDTLTICFHFTDYANYTRRFAEEMIQGDGSVNLKVPEPVSTVDHSFSRQPTKLLNHSPNNPRPVKILNDQSTSTFLVQTHDRSTSPLPYFETPSILPLSVTTTVNSSVNFPIKVEDMSNSSPLSVQIQESSSQSRKRKRMDYSKINNSTTTQSSLENQKQHTTQPIVAQMPDQNPGTCLQRNDQCTSTCIQMNDQCTSIDIQMYDRSTSPFSFMQIQEQATTPPASLKVLDLSNQPSSLSNQQQNTSRHTYVETRDVGINARCPVSLDTEVGPHHTEDWSDYLVDDMSTLLEKQTLSDFTLNVGTESIPVHRTVLCARSSIFESILTTKVDESPRGSEEVLDSTPADVRRFVRYLYTGFVLDLDPSSALGLYSLAYRYAVHKLREHCTCVVVSGLSTQTVCHVLSVSQRHNDMDLKSKAVEYIRDHEGEVLRSAEWRTLMLENPVLALEVTHTICLARSGQNWLPLPAFFYPEQ